MKSDHYIHAQCMCRVSIYLSPSPYLTMPPYAIHEDRRGSSQAPSEDLEKDEFRTVNTPDESESQKKTTPSQSLPVRLRDCSPVQSKTPRMTCYRIGSFVPKNATQCIRGRQVTIDSRRRRTWSLLLECNTATVPRSF